MKGTIRMTALAWAALIVARVFSSALINVTGASPSPSSSAAEPFLWGFCADLVAALVLSQVGARAKLSGWSLAVAVSAVYYGIHAVNAIEGVAYLDVSWWLVVDVLIVAILTVPAWKFIFGQNSAEVASFPWSSRSTSSWVSRFLLSDLSYLVIYFIAGMLVYPHVRDFYATRKMPSVTTIISLQLLFRGPVFVAICLLLVRMLQLPRQQTAWAVGAFFAVVGGVIPLMIPNPFMPESARLAHLCEVVSSNFVFGALTASLLWLDKRTGSVRKNLSGAVTASPPL